MEDDTGTVWCGTSRGLLRVVEAEGHIRLTSVPLPATQVNDPGVSAMLAHPDGTLWLATWNGLMRVWPDAGVVEHYSARHGLPRDTFTTLVRDAEGRMWVGARQSGGVSRLVAQPHADRDIVDRRVTRADGLPSEWIMSLRPSPDGSMWIGTAEGLALLTTNGNGAVRLRSYGDENGVCSREIWALDQDWEGNLWIGSSCGVTRVLRSGFTRYTTADGLGSEAINSIFETPAGDLFVTTNDGRRFVSRFDGVRFSSVLPKLPPPAGQPRGGGWGWRQTVLQDTSGRWWVPSGFGLFRFPRVVRLEELATRRPRHIPLDGPGQEAFRTFEDSNGDIWIAATGAAAGLLRWERTTEQWHDYHGVMAGLPAGLASAFREDAAGNLWIGISSDSRGRGALLRYRGGRFTTFGADEGGPQRWIRDLHLDRLGRLWIASSESGLVRLEDPAAERPVFVAYTIANGLSSDDVWSITEDESGRIYAGTSRGIDRLDPTDGAIRRFTTADGLPRDAILVSYRDRRGALWFGSLFGLARLVLEPEQPGRAPVALITGMRVAGEPRPLSALGETVLAPLTLAPGQRHVSIDFLGLGSMLGEALRYEYRLHGTGDDAWTSATARTVDFANLGPGQYRFEVRAIGADSVRSAPPAVALSPSRFPSGSGGGS